MANSFEYELTKEGNALITKYHPSSFCEDTVTVPDSIDGHPVLRIGIKAFRNASISHLYLPDCLLNLHADSFYQFSGGIHIPYNVAVSPGFTNGYRVTVYTAQGSGADESIKARKEKLPYYPKVNCVYEEASVIRDNGITYFLRSNQTLDLVECLSHGTELSIPSHCQGYPVKRICNGAFEKCAQLKTVSLPEGIELIGYGAFNNLKNLRILSLPESLHTIDCDGHGLFGYYGSKAEVVVRSSAGSYAESWCRKNGIVFQPSGTQIVIENGLTFLLNADGTAEVVRCDRSHKDVLIPAEFRSHCVVGIQAKAFEDCAGMLKMVIMEEGIRYIGEDAFRGIHSLKEALLPESLEVIGAGAFRMCSLTALKIPARVREIGDDAFGGRFNSAPTVTSGSYAESYCRENNILYNSIPPENAGEEVLVVQNGFILRLSGNHTVSVVEYTGSNAYAEIPKTYLTHPVTEIEAGAFRDVRHIKKLSISSTILKIGEHALPRGYHTVQEQICVGEEIIGYDYFQGCIKETYTKPIYQYITKDVPIVHVDKGSYAESYCIENKIPYSTI